MGASEEETQRLAAEHGAVVAAGAKRPPARVKLSAVGSQLLRQLPETRF